MPRDSTSLTVFISSTSDDLDEYRAVARNVILEMDWHPKMMEYFLTSPKPTTIDACREKVEQSDLLLLLVAFRRGTVPSVEQGGNGRDSFTALEVAWAREKKIPVLAMLASETWPGNRWEEDPEARNWVKRFRSELNLLAVFFDFEPVVKDESKCLPAFRAKVRQILGDYQARLLENLRSRGHQEPDLNYFEIAKHDMLDGVGIPFVGTGIYGDGPLSSVELARIFSGTASGEEPKSLATATEYRERCLGSRELFLDEFRGILEEREKKTDANPVCELISSINTLSLVVSATCDQVLEQSLDRTGREYVIVTHIVRSFDGEHDGKILILRKDSEPQICLADKVPVTGECCIIYKPLGSPSLHERMDPDLEIDTVVVTETDYLTFLMRLDNQHTHIPTPFGRIFQRRPLVFLGYCLDVWQYRLLMQVFQSLGVRGRRASSITVREPGTPMEEVAWRRLGADLIRMDTNEFARRVLAEARPPREVTT